MRTTRHGHHLELVVAQEKGGSLLVAVRPKYRRGCRAMTRLSPEADRRPSEWECQLDHQPRWKLRDYRDRIVGQSP